MDNKDDSKTKKGGSKQIQELKQRIEEVENKYRRALADYQNLEKRVAEERKEWVRKSNKELLLRLLPVLDTLMVAANHIKDEGLELSIKKFLDTLKEEGVEKIDVLGKSFDPQLMECVVTGEGEEDRVLEELRSGYTLHGQILRSAQVQVGKEKRKREKEEEEKAKEQLEKGDYM